MASTIPITPPEQFDFKRPDEWLKWKRRFEQFLSVSGLNEESEERRVSTLLYCLGRDADDVLTSTNIEDGDRKKYSKVLDKFDTHFKVRRNVIYERARFNKRDQLEGESAEEYITTLYSLVETCDYGPLKEEMLRDRLVVGIRNAQLSETLRMDPDLTLEKTKKLIRQKEALGEQTQQLHAVDKAWERSGILDHHGGITSMHLEITEIREAGLEGIQTATVQDVGKQSINLEIDVQPGRLFAENAIGKVTMLLYASPKLLQP